MNTKYMFMPVNVDDLNNELPEWQKELIDTRLQLIAEHPERLRPVEELFSELDKEE